MAKKKVVEAGVMTIGSDEELYRTAADEVVEVKKPQRYIVVSDAQDYNGKTCGLRFEAGRALLDPGAIDPRLGWTFEKVVLELKNLPGYTLLPVQDGADLWSLLRGVDLQNPEVRNEIALNEQAERNTAERRRLLGAT